MPDPGLGDEVWRAMAAVVFDHRDAWKRAVVDRTGLPFSRVRLLRRLAKGAMTATQLAAAATMDAPATTVAVNDLQARGLVVREADPTNRRSKLISLTEAGTTLLDVIDAIDDPAPAVIDALSTADLLALREILGRLEQG